MKKANDFNYPQEPQEVVQRHQADASVTKSSKNNDSSGYKQNIKTSPLGLQNDFNPDKKTLLGE